MLTEEYHANLMSLIYRYSQFIFKIMDELTLEVRFE